MKRKEHLILGLSSVILLLSCGGGGGSGSVNENTKDTGTGGTETLTIQGYFIDEPVSGLTIENTTAGYSAVTDASGRFSIQGNIGDELCFKVGNLLLGCIRAEFHSMVLTPQIINPLKAKEIVSLLHNIDEDKNPRNGISIPSNINFNNVTSINELNIGDTLESSLGAVTLDEPDMTVAQKNDLIAKGFNVMKRFEEKNLISSPTKVNPIANITEFKYSNISFDPNRSEVSLDTTARGTIDGYIQIYGFNCYVKGTFNCSGSSGRIYYDEAEGTVKGETPFECNASVNYDCGEDSGTETDNANCSGLLTINPTDIDWNNRKIIGTFNLQCNFSTYSEFDFTFTNTITLQGN